MSNKTSRKVSSAHGRQPRPGLQRSHGTQSCNTKPGSSRSRKTSPDISYRVGETHEDSMAPGLPQFCATCEKQIVTPGNSILYCSEFCRKKDASRPMSVQTVLSPSTNIPTAASYFDTPEPKIVQPRSPTVLRPASMIYSDVSTSEPDSPIEDREGSDIGVTSEAARYLAQFHSASYSGETTRSRRQRTSRNYSATDGIPSLSHTPSSSVGTVASIERSLPRRHDHSINHNISKSVDLVIPAFADYSPSNSKRFGKNESMESSTSTLTPRHVHKEGDESYEKRSLSHDDHSQTGSGLKQLFKHNGFTNTSDTDDTKEFRVINENGRYEDAPVGI